MSFRKSKKNWKGFRNEWGEMDWDWIGCAKAAANNRIRKESNKTRNTTRTPADQIIPNVGGIGQRVHETIGHFRHVVCIHRLLRREGEVVVNVLRQLERIILWSVQHVRTMQEGQTILPEQALPFRTWSLELDWIKLDWNRIEMDLWKTNYQTRRWRRRRNNKRKTGK